MLLILCGIPGSGKTTYARKLAEETGAILYCYDELPDAFSPSRQQAVRESMWTAIVEDLRCGQDVICDDLHITMEKRKKILQMVSGINCKKKLIVVDTPLQICLQRNSERERRLPDVAIRFYMKKFESPTLNEGWDEIIYYSSIKEVTPYDNKKLYQNTRLWSNGKNYIPRNF